MRRCKHLRDNIDAASFKEMILCADAALHANIQAINELNVFPVPDGDTGTNMCLTINNAAAELRRRNFDTVSAAADCVASATLRGARGNSGVILSLLFRGISKRLRGCETASAAQFAAAMSEGVDAAYKAVMKPAEGTILTVSRLAAASAVEAAGAGANLENTLLTAIEAGEEALKDTVNQNPVLKKAGVIDAGGEGYMVILRSILSSLRGEISSGAGANLEEGQSLFERSGDALTEAITFAFDTVFIVRKREPKENLEPLRRYLGSIGDSLVISEDDEIFKVHVHTDIPGSALNRAQKFGTLELAKIENMVTQAEQLKAGKKAQSADDLEEPGESAEEEPAEPEKEYGIVAVCAGAGMEQLFRDLGADGIVTGGQTMYTSNVDLHWAVNHTPASSVFVFPNNKNIVMAAEQCVPLTDKRVVVVPTKTVPQGVTALLSFRPDEPEDLVLAHMNEAMENVHTAMVTYAARDSDYDGHEIHAGEHLSLMDGALLGSYADVDSLLGDLMKSFEGFKPEFITIYYGADVVQEDAEQAAALLTERLPEAEVNVVSGGQPVYYYMISVE